MKPKTIQKTYYIALFLFFAIFYCIAHPLYLNSPDDWIYSSYARIAIPLPLRLFWNPSRIFPETIMPVIADFGAFVIHPVMNDYIQSIAISLGLFTAFAVTIYFWSFGLFLRRKFAVRVTQEIYLTFLFIVLHFWIFRSAPTNNVCILLSVPNLYFFYVIPALLNFSLVFLLESKTFHKGMAFSKWGGVILLFYLSLFSNIFVSIILASYAGLRMIYNTRKIVKNCPNQAKSLISISKAAINENKPYIWIVTAWLYSLVCDWFGGRSLEIRSVEQNAFFYKLKESFSYTMVWKGRFNTLFLIVSATILLLSVGLIVWKKNRELFRIESATCMWFGVIFIYQFLLCSAAGPSYMQRSCVALTFFIPVMIMIVLGAMTLLNMFSKSLMLMPVLLLIITSDVRTAQNAVFSGTDSRIIKAGDDYIIQQIVDADRSGELFVEVEYPAWYPDSKKTMTEGYIPVIAAGLYKHGITTKRMEVHLKP